MALDLALDKRGDLRIAPNSDLEVVTGQATVDQRIRVRLLIEAGEWELDPTNGTLGSRLRDALRLPVWRAQQEIPLMVREALEPMDDISIHDVIAEVDTLDPNGINLTITYSMIENDGTAAADNLTTTLTIGG